MVPVGIYLVLDFSFTHHHKHLKSQEQFYDFSEKKSGQGGELAKEIGRWPRKKPMIIFFSLFYHFFMVQFSIDNGAGV
jgi:hypothetical protein